MNVNESTIKSMLGYALVEEIRKGNSFPKEAVAKNILSNLDLAEEQINLLFLNYYDSNNELIDVFQTLNDLTDQIIKSEKFDRDSLMLIKDTVSLLITELTEGLEKYDIGTSLSDRKSD